MKSSSSVNVLEQRVYLNAFPKAGTHLAELFIRMTAAPVEGAQWLGTFSGNAWSDDWVDLERFQKTLEVWPAGGYIKGHCGYTPDIAEWLWNKNIVSIFVYRNLRDVVISQAHHIMNDEQADDGDRLKHPGKHLFRGMSFEDTVTACISGHGAYPGIVERWQLYRQWLDEKWVLPVRFEDMVNKPRKTGSRILRYVTGQSAAFYGHRVSLPQQTHDELINAQMDLIEQHRPVTFRRGVVGGWRDEWSPLLEQVWHLSGACRENQELGYESA